MHPVISYELATARLADLLRQAQHDARARVAVHVPSRVPRPGRRRIAVSFRVGRQRRFGQQLRALLHAQALLDDPATLPHQRHLPAQAAGLSGRQ
jgi:hypothetical protein